MTVLKWLGGIAVLLLIAFLGFYAYMGGFHTVKISEGSFGPAEIIYTTHKGPYEKLEESWTAFQSDWEEAGLAKCDALGVYLDSPETPPEDLRTIIGCRIDGLPAEQQASLRESFPVFVLPASDALVSSFPFKNVMSFFLAPMKVYPAMQKVMTEKNVSPPVAIETYGAIEDQGEIGFYMPVGVTAQDYGPLYEAF